MYTSKKDLVEYLSSMEDMAYDKEDLGYAFDWIMYHCRTVNYKLKKKPSMDSQGYIDWAIKQEPEKHDDRDRTIEDKVV